MGLSFHKDGVLRTRRVVRDPRDNTFTSRTVSVAGAEAVLDPERSGYFLSLLTGEVALEDGITVREILENLAPWSRMVGGLARMDFDAFLAEARLEGKSDTDLSHILMESCFGIEAVPEFDRSERMFKDGVFNLGKPVFTGQVKMESRWEMNVYLTEDGREKYDGETIVSVSLSPLRDWAHLEVRIGDTGQFRDTTGSGTLTFLGTSSPITDGAHPNVAVTRSASGTSVLHDIAITPTGATTFNVIIMGLLYEMGFHGTPSRTAAIRADVLKAASDLDAGDVDGTGSDHDAGDVYGVESDHDADSVDAEDLAEFEAERDILDRIARAEADMGLSED